MLANSLNTNEVKNSSGVEVEFDRQSSQGRTVVYAQKSESPAYPHRLKVSHQESGAGLRKRRRSVIRIDKTVLSSVDSATPVTVSAYCVLDTPEGALTTSAEPAHVLAELMSFLATTGAATTVLFDGTGTGAAALLAGSI